MTSEIDLERALIQKSAKLGCGSLSMSLALATASLCILIPPVASLASFTKPPLGPEWALIRANAPHAIVQPGAVTIGMFQTCIITPAVRCSALAWPPKFDGPLGKWQGVLPDGRLMQAWPAVGAAAFVTTFMAAFCFCQCTPQQYIWLVGSATTLVDLTYLILTGVLYYLIHSRVSSTVGYNTNPVLMPLILYVVTNVLLGGVAIGMFIARQTDANEEEWRKLKKLRSKGQNSKQDKTTKTGLLNSLTPWLNGQNSSTLANPGQLPSHIQAQAGVLGGGMNGMTAQNLLGGSNGTQPTAAVAGQTSSVQAATGGMVLGAAPLPVWRQVLAAGGEAAIVAKYGAHGWQNPYKTDPDLKEEDVSVARHRAQHEKGGATEMADDDKQVIEEAQVEKQTADIDYGRKREKLDKQRKAGQISEADYWSKLRKLEKKREKLSGSTKVQRAYLAKRMANLFDDTGSSVKDANLPSLLKRNIIMQQRLALIAQVRGGQKLLPNQVDFLKRTHKLAVQLLRAPGDLLKRADGNASGVQQDVTAADPQKTQIAGDAAASSTSAGRHAVTAANTQSAEGPQEKRVEVPQVAIGAIPIDLKTIPEVNGAKAVGFAALAAAARKRPLTNRRSRIPPVGQPPRATTAVPIRIVNNGINKHRASTTLRPRPRPRPRPNSAGQARGIKPTPGAADVGGRTARLGQVRTAEALGQAGVHLPALQTTGPSQAAGPQMTRLPQPGEPSPKKIGSSLVPPPVAAPLGLGSGNGESQVSRDDRDKSVAQSRDTVLLAWK